MSSVHTSKHAVVLIKLSVFVCLCGCLCFAFMVFFKANDNTSTMLAHRLHLGLSYIRAVDHRVLGAGRVVEANKPPKLRSSDLITTCTKREGGSQLGRRAESFILGHCCKDAYALPSKFSLKTGGSIAVAKESKTKASSCSCDSDPLLLPRQTKLKDVGTATDVSGYLLSTPSVLNLTAAATTHDISKIANVLGSAASATSDAFSHPLAAGVWPTVIVNMKDTTRSACTGYSLH